MILAFDSETSGMPDFNKQAEDPSQPHIVQLGAILFDSNRRVVSELNLLVRPVAGPSRPRSRPSTASRRKRR